MSDGVSPLRLDRDSLALDSNLVRASHFCSHTYFLLCQSQVRHKGYRLQQAEHNSCEVSVSVATTGVVSRFSVIAIKRCKAGFAKPRARVSYARTI